MNKPAKLKMALERFLSRYPLLGGILASWTIKMGETDTMAVGYDGTELTLFVSPHFIENISLEEAVAVLHHEVRHVVYGHIFMTREEFPDEEAQVIAQEITVNENMPEPLPGSPITLSQYPSLPPDEGTIERYDRLARRKKGTSKSARKQDSGMGQGMAKPLDDHSHWKEVQKNIDSAMEALKAAARGAMKDAQRRGLEIDNEILESIERLCGDSPGSLKEELNALGHGNRIPWQVILRRYLGEEIARGPSYRRPPRRFPELLGIVPGSGATFSEPHLLACIDTSGSMSVDEIEKIACELSRLRRDYSITIVEFDCQVHAVYPLRGKIAKVSGRGGTDFNPVLDPGFLKKIAADLVLLFTDGFGPAPKNAPRIPVIWVLTGGGAVPVDWGRTIRL